MNEKEVIITSLVIQMARDYFKYLSKIYKVLLDMFSRIYELQIADMPRSVEGMSLAAITTQENRYESGQRLFSAVKFSDVDSIYQLAHCLQSDEQKISLFTALRDVSR
jgi:hypothetical protein